MTLKKLKPVSVAIFIILILIYVVTESYNSEGQKTDESTIRVEKIYDGDTIGVKIKNRSEKVRLIGIDAPEIGQGPWGLKSKKYLQELISSSSWRVIIEYDVERRDKYDRILGYIRTPDGKMLNEEMLKNGYAVLFTYPPNVKHVDEVRAAEKDARDKMLGIWGMNGLKQRPYNYRKDHPRR